MSIAIIPTQNIMIPSNANKDALSRLARYAAWLEASDRVWYQPDLDSYRDHLLGKLSASSVQAHLSTIRGQYLKLMNQRDLFFAALPPEVAALPFHQQKPYVDEMIERLKNALKLGQVKTVTKQDRADEEHLRLTVNEANTLIRLPGTGTLLGLRNTAIIAMMLATGIREQELCDLRVDDLRHRLDGELALLIREGKGSKQRLVPYGDNHSVLLIVDAWLATAGITDGYIFQGVDQFGGRELSGEPISTRTVQRVLNAYPLVIDGKKRAAKPHDLRRTYARRQYDAGLDVQAIKQNLGHKKVETTLGYIGQLDAKQRRSKGIFDFGVLIMQQPALL